MKEKPKIIKRTVNCPKLPDGTCLRDSPKCPYILIKANGDVRYEKNRLAKDQLVAAFEEDKGDVLLVPWVGEWSTDVFSITKKQLEFNKNL